MMDKDRELQSESNQFFHAVGGQAKAIRMKRLWDIRFAEYVDELRQLQLRIEQLKNSTLM